MITPLAPSDDAPARPKMRPAMRSPDQNEVCGVSDGEDGGGSGAAGSAASAMSAGDHALIAASKKNRNALARGTVTAAITQLRDRPDPSFRDWRGVCNRPPRQRVVLPGRDNG